jgi:putative transposase
MINKVKTEPEASVRRICSVLGFRRQTYYSRLGGKRPEDTDKEISDLLHQVTKRFIAWGFWKVYHYLRSEGHKWNHKRVYRVWKSEKLNLRTAPQRSRIRRVYQELLSPSNTNEGWAVDFLTDWVVGPEEQSVRIINLMDECSRKVLWTEAHSRISAKTLIEILDRVVDWRGTPSYIRCDNGPEFISRRLSAWTQSKGIEIKFTQPGKPSQNGLIERLNKTLRAECLNLSWFGSIEELNENIQAWSHSYNHYRPHHNLKFLTPDKFESLNPKFYSNLVAQ